MQMTLEQRKARLLENYMNILRIFKDFGFDKYVPLQERACNIMKKACKHNHDIYKLNMLLGKYLIVKFDAMQ